MRQHKVKSVYPGKLRIRYFLPYEKRTCSPQVVYYYWLSVSTSSPFSPSPGKNQSLSYHLWCFSTSGGLAISLCHSYTLDDPANHTAQHAWGLPSSPWEGKHWEATTTTPIEPISSQMKILQSCGLNTTVVSQQVRNVYKNLPSGPARGPPGAQEQMNTTRHNEPVRLQEAPSAMPVHLSEEGLCFGLAKGVGVTCTRVNRIHGPQQRPSEKCSIAFDPHVWDLTWLCLAATTVSVVPVQQATNTQPFTSRKNLKIAEGTTLRCTTHQQSRSQMCHLNTFL